MLRADAVTRRVCLAPSRRVARADVSVQAAFCVLAVVCNFLVFRLMIRGLDREIKATRGLLVLLPNDVVAGVKVLKDALLDFNKRVR